jgi:hypothetical protein
MEIDPTPVRPLQVRPRDTGGIQHQSMRKFTQRLTEPYTFTILSAPIGQGLCVYP